MKWGWYTLNDFRTAVRKKSSGVYDAPRLHAVGLLENILLKKQNKSKSYNWS